jgi:hypothetical protein
MPKSWQFNRKKIYERPSLVVYHPGSLKGISVQTFTNEAPLDKRALEHNWAQQLAKKSLTGQEFQQWNSYRSNHRIYPGIGYKLVHWVYEDGEPTIVQSFTLEEVQVDTLGVAYLLQSNTEDFWVTQEPSLLGDTGVFVWVPYFNEFRFRPEAKDFRGSLGYLRMSLCVRQEDRPFTSSLRNGNYLTTLQEFEAAST